MSLYSKVKRIGEKAGIGRLCPRMLRHTYIIRLYKYEQDLRLVQKQVGHANRKTTAMHLRTFIGIKQKAIKNDNTKASTEKTTKDFHFPETNKLIKFQNTIEPERSIGSKSVQQIVTCEACSTSILAENGTMIDSGQILSPLCISEIRKNRSNNV